MSLFDRFPEPTDTVVPYKGNCIDCDMFTECPCGCQFGYCEEDPQELYDGAHNGCEYGIPSHKEYYG